MNKNNCCCHSELVSESMVGSAWRVGNTLNGSCQRVNGFRTKSGMTDQSGRSMVEMLGVLAIIGVLSVGGISGYTTAMNKHKANEILNAAAVRAMAVSTQLQNGAETPSLGEFTDNTVGDATFKNTVDVDDTTGRFTIGFTSGPSTEVLKQIENIAGTDGIVRAITSGGLTYNKDLSADKIASDYKSPDTCEVEGANRKWCTDTCIVGNECPAPAPSCTGSGTDGALLECETCSGGVAVDDDSICLAKEKGLCVDGTCQASKFTSGCTTNADCQGKESIDGVDCKNNTCYCNYGGYENEVDCNNGPTKGGTCKIATINQVGTKYKDSNNKEYILSQDDMDWFSAKNFCSALPGNHHMVTLEESGVDPLIAASVTGGPGEISDVFVLSIFSGTQLSPQSWWIKDLPEGPHSCLAYYVSSGTGIGGISGGSCVGPYYRHNDSYNALCK